MSADCIFCEIGTGKIVTHKVYEDQDVIAFMDKHPINPGHTLVIPKKHVKDFISLNNQLLVSLIKVARQIGRAIDKTVKPRKVGIVIAGFDIAHVHVHLIPMHNYHDITSKAYLENERSNPSAQELHSVAEDIKQNLK